MYIHSLIYIFLNNNKLGVGDISIQLSIQPIFTSIVSNRKCARNKFDSIINTGYIDSYK